MRTTWLHSKKTTAAVYGEVQKEIDRIVSQYGKENASDGSFDLEAFEISIRSGMHGVGSKLLETLLNADDGYRGSAIACENGHTAVFVDYREKKLYTGVSAVLIVSSL